MFMTVMTFILAWVPLAFGIWAGMQTWRRQKASGDRPSLLSAIVVGVLASVAGVIWLAFALAKPPASSVTIPLLTVGMVWLWRHAHRPAAQPSTPHVTPAASGPAVEAVPAHSVERPAIRTLRWMCREFAADGTVDEVEIRALQRWLDDHPHVRQDALVALLADHIDVVLADGEVSILESLDVLALVEAIALGKTIEQMAGWQALADSAETPCGKVRRRKDADVLTATAGQPLDTIRFSYENSEGEYSERTVRVRSLGGEYFRGHCLKRRADRTFRLDRVIGEVTSEDTGEVADAWRWADGLRACARR